MGLCRECVFWEPNQRLGEGVADGLNKTYSHPCRHYKMVGVKFGGSAHQQSHECPYFIPDEEAKLLPGSGSAY
jgi:hypothetical protein